MSKKILIGAVALMIISLLTVNSFSAQGYQIYVRNQPFMADNYKVNGIIYAKLEPFLKALGFGWKESSGRINLYYLTNGLKSPDFSSDTLNFYWNNKPVNLKVISKNQKLFIPLKDTALKLNAVYLSNNETGIIDVMYTLAGEKASAGSSGSSDLADASADKKTEDQKEPEVITADLQYYQQWNPNYNDPQNPNAVTTGGMATGTLTVTNTSDKKVTNVQIDVNLLDGYGKPLTTIPYSIGDMDPGAVVKKDFSWNNPNPTLNFTKKIDIKHDPLEKEKPKTTDNAPSVPQVVPPSIGK